MCAAALAMDNMFFSGCLLLSPIILSHSTRHFHGGFPHRDPEFPVIPTLTLDPHHANCIIATCHASCVFTGLPLPQCPQQGFSLHRMEALLHALRVIRMITGLPLDWLVFFEKVYF